jgi:hypothetical protein
LALLLIVTRMGRDYRPGPRERIERGSPEGSVGEVVSPLSRAISASPISDFTGLVAPKTGKKFFQKINSSNWSEGRNHVAGSHIPT